MLRQTNMRLEPRGSLHSAHFHLKRSLAIFLTCSLIYGIAFSGHHYSIDGVVMFEQAKTLLFDRSFVIDPPVRWGIDITTGKWPLGLTLAYLPLLALLAGTVFRGDPSIRQIPFDPALSHNPELLKNEPYLYSAFLHALLTAATAVVLYRLCLRLGFPSKRASAVALVFGLASPAAAYAKFDYAQPLASLFLLLAFFFVLRAQRGRSGNLACAGLAAGLGFIARPEMLLPAAVLLVAACFLPGEPAPAGSPAIRRKIARLAEFGLPLLLLLTLNQWLNSQRSGSWLSLGYNPSAEFTQDPGSVLTALLGNLVSPGRGILLFFPLSLLSPWGFGQLRRRNRWFAAALAACLASLFLVYGAWKEWGAGISWGPRFLIPMLPYLALLAFLGYDRFHKSAPALRLALFGLLLAAGGLVALQGLLFNFLDFYAGFNLPPPLVDQGDYHFLARYSPILSGWGPLDTPNEYDIFWLETANVRASHGRTYLALFAGFAGLGFAFKAWLDVFLDRRASSLADRATSAPPLR